MTRPMSAGPPQRSGNPVCGARLRPGASAGGRGDQHGGGGGTPRKRLCGTADPYH